MSLPNISYQSFCWVIGTTSFRTAKLNLKIEQQLLLLNELYTNISGKEQEWQWNSALQTEFYNLMHERGFLVGDAQRRDKDARQKTSGLVDIGLVTSDRKLTEVGKLLLKLSQQNDFTPNNEFHLEKDSYLYFKQLLKTTLSIGNNTVRPYFILAHLLSELAYLSYDEFCYFLPICISTVSTEKIIQAIKDYRNQKIDLITVIYQNLRNSINYNSAYNIFLENDVNEDLVCLIGMNRKSANYDKPYYGLYLALEKYFLHQNGSAFYLLSAVKKVKQSKKWMNLIFNTGKTSEIRKLDRKSIKNNCPFLKCQTENDLKSIFFKYLHVFKAMATLEDYFDLNRRYFGLSDTIIFTDQKVKFDLIPRCFFKNCHQELFKSAFTANDKIDKDIKLSEINSVLIFDNDKIYSQIYKEYNVLVENSEQASNLVENLRLQRFNALINQRFNKSKLINLLSCFEERNDNEIANLVTDEADIPTIFEYIIAIIWYEISERQGNILDYMKLSLSADLLPKTHAGGGYADIIYEYEKTGYYPKHSLLIEATLAERSNQRRMEMEPVSRHLGEYRLKYSNSFDYSLFITTFLNLNVISDFCGRKHTPYYGNNGDYIDSLKIIPMNTGTLSQLLENNVKYRNLYSFFEEQYQLSLPPKEWYDNMLREQQGIYQVKG
ncbi:AlwI family type II restriction endonuclease [Pasteurella multocida]|uniref:AlwI family type II restriction endonuclease n=1 Tax=Pasteurella multocida TaxID=747 RepID=UPI0029315314|nr:AlwI family type II restriction endonuclease [Pasteurella multocida]